MKVYCALVYFLKVQKYHCSVKNNLRSSARDSSPVLHLHPQPVTLGIARLGQCTVTSQGASVCVTGGRVTSLCYEQAE